jgi:hypothetical protein
MKLTFSTGLLDESDHQVLMRGADVYNNNNHTNSIVFDLPIVSHHDCDRHFIDQ